MGELAQGHGPAGAEWLRSVHTPQNTGTTQQWPVRQVCLANALETGPSSPPLAQNSHTAAPQEVAEFYFSQH